VVRRLIAVYIEQYIAGVSRDVVGPLRAA